MMKHFKQIAIALAAVAAAALIFLLVYLWILPGASYRQLVVGVTKDNAVASAEIIRDGQSVPLTDKQTLAVASWLAEYRSENNGISHSAERGGYELLLHMSDADRGDIRLNVEQNAIVFPGVMGDYRIELESGELFDLLNDILNGGA